MSQSVKMLGALGVIGLSAISAQAAIVATFGEATAPTVNVITSYEAPDLDDNSWFNDPPGDWNGWRLVSESFTVPAGTDYTLDKITMKIGQTLRNSFTAPSGFSVDIYKIADPVDSPASGTIVAGQVGTMQPTSSTASAGTYFTFDLDDTVTLEAGASYTYVLGLDNPPEVYKFISLAKEEVGADPAGSRAWQNTNGGGWISPGTTYVYYIQGTPVPEPTTGGLLLLGLSALARRVRR